MPYSNTPADPHVIQGKRVRRVPVATMQVRVACTPTLAHDAHIRPNIAECHDHLLRPGLRLNPEAWEVYESEKQ